MSENNGQNLSPEEAALLDPDDPRRAALAGKVTDTNGRAGLEQAWAEADRLRAALPQVDVPAGFQTRLLAIPDSPSVTGDAAPESTDARQLARARRKIAWPALAAALVLVAALLTALVVWQPWTPKPVPLAASLRQSMAIWAVKESNTPLAIASADPAAVEKKLASYPTDFPVMLLQPTGKLTLEGGGACDFGPAHAVYTRWAGDGYTCTLYQFNGTDLGAPPLFNAAPETPTELWRDNLHYRVVLFPGAGGKCCWALVMDTDKAVNNFAKYTSGTY